MARIEKESTAKKIKYFYLEKHLLLGIFIKGDSRITRVERWTMFLCITVSDLFISGLFYETDRNADEEETESEESAESTFSSYQWKDFWILVYTILFTVPIPLILAFLFKRQKIDFHEGQSQIRKIFIKQKIKRVIGFIIAACWVLWCFYSSLMFSLEFGYNTTQIWIVNFSLAAAIEIVAKDALVAMCVSIVFVLLILCKLKVRRNVARIAHKDN